MSHPRTPPRPQPRPQPRNQPRNQPRTQPRTLWEEGDRPGRQVVTLSTLAVVTLAGLNLALNERLSLFFDMSFVVVCMVAAFVVRPRDFFAVGVLPPLLMLGVVTLLALVARGAVADEMDSLVQAVVSGLAHHAGAIVAGYGLSLAVLALRQLARKNAGRLHTIA